jgi:hypothetical protein
MNARRVGTSVDNTKACDGDPPLELLTLSPVREVSVKKNILGEESSFDSEISLANTFRRAYRVDEVEAIPDACDAGSGSNSPYSRLSPTIRSTIL